MIICGFQKLTLLDFPGHTACTVFTGGCNMRCPFCHNSDLVNMNIDNSFSETEIFDFLKKRQGLLDGVAITGGEPLLQKDIIDFIKSVKALGYKIKLDTNGTFPDKLNILLTEGLVDYVAMDIKNSKEKYSLTAGKDIDITLIEKSVNLLKNSPIDHEFRTTVVKELHDIEDIEKIAKWLSNNEKYYLQLFNDSGNNLCDGLSAPSTQQIKKYAHTANSCGVICNTRGV